VQAALRRRKLTKHYDQRVQIRARIMGISAPRFTAQQRATLLALHAVETHLQPWVDPAGKCSNAATRLAFLCHRMGWWEHLPAPRILAGAQSQAYNAVYRTTCAALGWPFFPYAQMVADRAEAQTLQAALERERRCQLVKDAAPME